MEVAILTAVELFIVSHGCVENRGASYVMSTHVKSKYQRYDLGGSNAMDRSLRQWLSERFNGTSRLLKQIRPPLCIFWIMYQKSTFDLDLASNVGPSGEPCQGDANITTKGASSAALYPELLIIGCSKANSQSKEV